MSDLGRYQRMADRAKQRRLGRGEQTRADLEAIAPPALPGEGPPEYDPGGPHHGHRTHAGGAHGFGVVCSCGELRGCFSGIIEDGYVTPIRCEVCDARGIAHLTGVDRLSLTAGDWCDIPGRGRLATFPGVLGLDPRPLVGQVVEIDGERYMVRAVETHALPDATGKPFGLLVDDR